MRWLFCDVVDLSVCYSGYAGVSEGRDKHFLIETPGGETSYPGVVERVFCGSGSDESGCFEVAEGSAGCSDGYGCGWF